MFKLGACASERGAAGTTPGQVKQSLIGAGIVLLGALPIGDAIGGLLGLFRGATTVASDATTAAEEEVVPILRYPGKSLPDTAQNMARYMNDNGLDATSTFTRVGAKLRDANRAANALLYKGGPSMDEFPFASTAQGGPGAYLTQVSIAEQRAQGTLLSTFYRQNGIQPGDPFGIWIDWNW